MDTKVNFESETLKLVEVYAQQCKNGPHFGSMSPNVYDTAWVSMVIKSSQQENVWLFPEAFRYVLDQQQADGGWQVYADPVDSILNTAAALLAMLKYRNNESVSPRLEAPCDLSQRIERGISWLQDALQHWDVKSCNHVGFEILVPALLCQLREHGAEFNFPGSRHLDEVNKTKLAKFDPEILYRPAATSLLHSLEAFIGRIDFGKVRHHRIEGGLMGSPAATAAYLMNVSPWDEEAEDFLHRAAKKSAATSFPSAFPTSIFETSWILSTLLQDGIVSMKLESCSLIDIISFLERAISNHEDNVVGFAPGILSDADDTSQVLQVLARSGRVTRSRGLIETFFNGENFRTYHSERNASISTNCNALKALILIGDIPQYATEISRTVTYLCDAWYSSSLKDKWNTSDLYSTMLLAQAFVLLLRCLDSCSLPVSLAAIVEQRVPIVLTQIHSRVLLQQHSNGSWSKGSSEVAAYGTLTLKSLLDLPWSIVLQAETTLAIEKAERFIIGNYDFWDEHEYLWIEKVTCAMPNIARAYCLAAVQARVAPHKWSNTVRSIVPVHTEELLQFAQFYSSLPLFQNHPKSSQTILCSLVEGCSFYGQLKDMSNSIFPRSGMTKDNYLKYIPFTWTSCNNMRKAIDTQSLLDMMCLSVLNFQVDEYMESVVGTKLSNSLDQVEEIIRRIFAPSAWLKARKRRSSSTGHTEVLDSHIITPPGSKDDEHDSESTATLLYGVEEVLRKFTDHVLEHPKVIKSPPTARQLLRFELKEFLLGHMAQIRDSMRHFDGNDTCGEVLSDLSYYKWVRSTAGDNTSCPFSFSFYCCLISDPGKAFFATIKQKYLYRDLCRHLATMCRQYNDYGSVARDRAEKNLNSLDFPEFRYRETGELETTSDEASEIQRKKYLMWLAEYERSCMNGAFQRLEKESSSYSMHSITTFINVTDLYGQIYVARDIASHQKRTKRSEAS